MKTCDRSVRSLCAQYHSILDLRENVLKVSDLGNDKVEPGMSQFVITMI